MIRLIDLLKESLLDSILQEYIKWSKYDILNSWGSCAFYTQDFLEFCKATGKSCKVVYLPLANPPGNDPEDHIIPMYNNTLIDFAYVPGKGVSKHDRTGNPEGKITSNWPLVSKASPKLFEKQGVYGKLGYLSDVKYAEWEYDEFPDLKKNVYPIILNKVPGFSEDSIKASTPKLKSQLQEIAKDAVNTAPQGVLELQPKVKVLVGDNHHDSVELSKDLFNSILDIGIKYGFYGEGKGIEFNPGVMSSKIYKALKDAKATYKKSWDDKVTIPNDEKYVYIATVFSNPTENNRVARLLSKAKDSDTIFDLLAREVNNHTQKGLNLGANDLKKFLEEMSEKGIEFIKLSKQKATKENLQNFIDKGEQLTWPSNWKEYPNKAGKLARRETIIRDQWLIDKAPPGVYFIGSGHLTDIAKMTGKNIIDGSKIGTGSSVQKK
jgi:hypothetical protein